MSRALFIGDSQTCGYWSHPTKTGPGSYSYWNDNNYAEIYGEDNNKPVAIYAMAGVCNRVYTDWLAAMFKKYDDIDEVFICLAPFNRFRLAFDGALSDNVISIDYFTEKMESSNGTIDRYCDLTIKEENLQMFNKALDTDYNKFPGVDIDIQKGLASPNLRKNTFMEVKLFFELNTFIEKRDFLLDVYAWDRMCGDNGAKLYLFNFTERLKYPQIFEYYGKLKNTVIATKTIEGYLSNKMIDYKKYYLEDKEHFNREYHSLIATKYIPWLKSL
jgi:hypothetical protein